MSIELRVRPASAAAEQAAELLESGKATAEASIETLIERLGELELEDGLRRAGLRLRSEADGFVKELELPSERDRVAMAAAAVVVLVVAVASILLIRRRRASVARAARKAKRKTARRTGQRRRTGTETAAAA
jgi:hypothetical protein